MPRQTQTYPAGLIDLLQLKDPSAFGVEDNYRPTFECIDILGNQRVTLLSATTNTVVDGSTSAAQVLTVPNGQVWVMVSAAALIIAQDPGDVMQVSIRINRQGRNGPVLASSDKITATLAGERAWASLVYPRPTIYNAGDQIALNALFSAAVAGPTTAQIAAEYYRFGPESLGSAL